jgi:rhodanese-related sulfurtransferase
MNRADKRKLMTTVLIIVAVFILFILIIGKLKTKGLAMTTAAEAKALIETSNAAILDVRTPEEYRGGHLKNARLIPVDELAGRIGEIADLKDRSTVVYCRGGNRSAAASRFLLQNGFTKVSNLDGGIMAWSAAGLPVEKGSR